MSSLGRLEKLGKVKWMSQNKGEVHLRDGSTPYFKVISRRSLSNIFSKYFEPS